MKNGRKNTQLLGQVEHFDWVCHIHLFYLTKYINIQGVFFNIDRKQIFITPEQLNIKTSVFQQLLRNLIKICVASRLSVPIGHLTVNEKLKVDI